MRSGGGNERADRAKLLGYKKPANDQRRTHSYSVESSTLQYSWCGCPESYLYPKVRTFCTDRGVALSRVQHEGRNEREEAPAAETR